MVKVKFGVKTDIGKVRGKNEDGYLALNLFSQEKGFLFAVADGMGGHLGGEVASSLSLRYLKQTFQKKPPPKGLNLKQALNQAFQKASQTIFSKSLENPQLRGMGTTLTALILGPNKSYLAQVGDSRCYLLRQGELKQLTEDHSLVWQMVKEGKLSPEEAETHPLRSILTRALGTESQVKVDFFSLTPKPQDKILLCSDGLNIMLKDEEIKAILDKELPPQELSEDLVKAANFRGGLDNITVILVELEGSSESGQE